MITRRTLLGLFSASPFVYLFTPVKSNPTVFSGDGKVYYGLKGMSMTSTYELSPIFGIGDIEIDKSRLDSKPEIKGVLTIVDEAGNESFAEFDISNLKWIHKNA